MKILPLGGASEIGASATIVEIGARTILVDAGIRMGGASGDPLPDLSRLEEFPPELVIVTHAHTDHIGALPLVHGSFPKVPILATSATAALMRILFSDALRIMDAKCEEGGEIPLYGAEAVASTLARITKVSFGQELRPLGGDLSITFHLAGHILGASMVELRTRRESLLMSGDISIDPQRTVAPAFAPKGPFDVVVAESTYGARLHANRKTQEDTLVTRLADTVRAGGRALVPAFAVGRAQEVLLILKDAFAKGVVAPFPVRVDGLVRAVSSAYGAFAGDASRELARRIEREPSSPFYDDWIRPVDSRERAGVLDLGPCAIVASSGMLSGGPSAFYAAALAGDAANHILITGYQDDEAPGRKIQEAAMAGGGQIPIGGRLVDLACGVSTYHLSAHADGDQVAGFVRALGAKAVVLVHGEAEGRAALAAKIALEGKSEVYCPDNGDRLEFDSPDSPSGGGRAGTRETVPIGSALGKGRLLREKELAELHGRLFGALGSRRPLTAADAARAWYGSAEIPQTEFEKVRGLLAGDDRFVPDRKRPYLFRLAEPEAAGKGSRAGDRPLEQNALLALVSDLFAGDLGLYKKGCRSDSHELVLYFHFPEVAACLHAGTIARIESESRWKVVVHPEVHQGTLAAAATESLPAGWVAARAPSIRMDEKIVDLKVAAESFDDALAAQVAGAFRERTGWSLKIAPASPGTAPAKRERDDAGRLEINLAFAAIDRAFAAERARPTRKSRKSIEAGPPAIELSFITREVGSRYQEMLGSLAAEIGWPITIRPEPDHNAVIQAVKSLLPETWRLKKTPGLYPRESAVEVRLMAPPAEGEPERAKAAILEATGYQLRWRIG